jgi:hypothetical protein
MCLWLNMHTTRRPKRDLGARSSRARNLCRNILKAPSRSRYFLKITIDKQSVPLTNFLCTRQGFAAPADTRDRLPLADMLRLLQLHGQPVDVESKSRVAGLLQADNQVWRC